MKWAPFELEDEVIVAEVLFRDDRAEAVAADVELAVLDGEDVTRVFVLRVLQPGVHLALVVVGEQVDSFGRGDGLATVGKWNR